jgi:hypothetical protein
MWPNHCSLHRDSTPAHDTYCLGVLAKKFVIKLEYPPYLQDLALKTFGYSQNSHAFRETHNIQAHAMTILMSIPKEGF